MQLHRTCRPQHALRTSHTFWTMGVAGVLGKVEAMRILSQNWHNETIPSGDSQNAHPPSATFRLPG